MTAVSSPRPPSRLQVSAPGKLMLAGEYAVLYGAPALVTAVSRRAWASLRDGSEQGWSDSAGSAGAAPEVVVARALAEAAHGAVPGVLDVDVSSLQQSVGATRRKLGLGSSAAGAAATVGVVLAAHGADLESEPVRQAMVSLAMEAHRRIAPNGSGADVTAAVLGGFVRFVREGHQYRAQEVTWPKELPVRVVWSGHPARTSELVALVEQLREAQPAVHRAAIDLLASVSSELLDAVSAADVGRAIVAVDAHHRAMKSLGDAAGAPIVEDSLEAVAVLARHVGGAAKPSGAGGGDVAIAVFPDHDAARQFDVACTKTDLTLLSLALGAAGVRREWNDGAIPTPTK
jgi:phosphomevalonate kinase